jgi:hypothetical protein
LSYLFDLRPGNTFSSVDASLWIDNIFECVPKGLERWYRADSAYGTWKVFSSLMIKQVKFTIVLKENIGKYVRKKNQSTLEWRKTKTIFFDSEKCEVATGVYPLKRLGSLRVVFIRAPKKNRQLELWDDGEESGYDYYSIITNVGSSEMTEEEVIDFYRGRANAENYIREQKYGYDFLHFPCKKLRANKIFGLIGTMSHNAMRALSFCMEQKKKRVRGKDDVVRTVIQLGYFAKKVRTELMNIPCQMVRSARKVKLRLSALKKEVLERICEKIRQLCLQKVVLSHSGSS